MALLLTLIEIFVGLAFIGYQIWFICAILRLRSVPPFVPARKSIGPFVVRELGPLPEGAVFYELGAGDGRILSAVARANPGAACIGIEKYFVPYCCARVRGWLDRLPNASYRRESFFATDLTRATHVYAYLYSKTLDELLPKLERELPAGAQLVSLDFHFEKKAPARVWSVPDSGQHRRGTHLRLYVF